MSGLVLKQRGVLWFSDHPSRDETHKVNSKSSPPVKTLAGLLVVKRGPYSGKRNMHCTNLESGHELLTTMFVRPKPARALIRRSYWDRLANFYCINTW
jgi:hypothetical protein